MRTLRQLCSFLNDGGGSPKPIIVDFDGDGSNDVLLVTQDATVEQYKYRASAGNKIGDLSLVRSSTFSNQLRVSSRLAPAAAATGSLSSVGDDGKVLVVVTHGLSVHCLDSKLNILWERNLGRDLRASNYVRCATIHHERRAKLTFCTFLYSAKRPS